MSAVPATEAVFRPVVILVSGRMLGFIAAFLIPVILARVFNQNDFGSYKQLFLIYATLFGIAQLGMAESLYYFLPMDKERSGVFVFNALLVMGMAGALAALLLWWQSEAVASLLNNPELATYIPYVGLYLLFILLAVVLEIVLTARKKHIAASAAYASSDLARAVFYLTPVLAFASLGWLMFGAILYALLRLVATAVYLISASAIEFYTNARLLKKHLAYALPFGLAGLIEVAQLNFHLYAVSYYFDAATFAIYAVGCLQIPLIDILMTSTSNVMMINMRAKANAGDRSAVRAIWVDSVAKMSYILFPLVAILLLLAPLLIVLLFGAAYQDSVPIFMVWTASTLFTVLLTDGFLRVYAENRFLILQNLLRLFVVVVLIQSFLQRFDLLGAVLVTTVATIIVKVVALQRVKRILETSFKNLLPWKALASTGMLAATAALPAGLFLNYVLLPPALMIVAAGSIYMMSYALLFFWLGPLNADEKQEFLNWLLVLPRKLRHGSRS